MASSKSIYNTSERQRQRLLENLRSKSKSVWTGNLDSAFALGPGRSLAPLAAIPLQKRQDEQAQEFRLIAAVMPARIADPFPIRLPGMLVQTGIGRRILARLDDRPKSISAGRRRIVGAGHHAQPQPQSQTPAIPAAAKVVDASPAAA